MLVVSQTNFINKGVDNIRSRQSIIVKAGVKFLFTDLQLKLLQLRRRWSNPKRSSKVSMLRRVCFALLSVMILPL